MSPLAVITYIKSLASQLKHNLLIIYFIYLHPSTPLLWRFLLLATLSYALSPIDLIPDFIPIIGHLDDLVIVPLMLALALRYIPSTIYRDAKEKAMSGARMEKTSGRFVVAVGIVGIYVLSAWFVLKQGLALLYWVMQDRMEEYVVEQ